MCQTRYSYQIKYDASYLQLVRAVGHRIKDTKIMLGKKKKTTKKEEGGLELFSAEQRSLL